MRGAITLLILRMIHINVKWYLNDSNKENLKEHEVKDFHYFDI